MQSIINGGAMHVHVDGGTETQTQTQPGFDIDGEPLFGQADDPMDEGPQAMPDTETQADADADTQADAEAQA